MWIHIWTAASLVDGNIHHLFRREPLCWGQDHGIGYHTPPGIPILHIRQKDRCGPPFVDWDASVARGRQAVAPLPVLGSNVDGTRNGKPAKEIESQPELTPHRCATNPSCVRRWWGKSRRRSREKRMSGARCLTELTDLHYIPYSHDMKLPWRVLHGTKAAVRLSREPTRPLFWLCVQV